MSNYTIELVQLPPQRALVTRGEAPPHELGQVLGHIFPTIAAYIADKGLTTAGPPHLLYLCMSDVFEFEAGIAVVENDRGKGDIVIGHLPGGAVAKTVHVGPYEELGAAHEALVAWATEHGYDVMGPAWDVYVNDPAEVVDPARYETCVHLKVAKLG